MQTPEDVVYEALRTTLALRGIDQVSKSADKGLRLIAEVTAREVARRVRAEIEKGEREPRRGPTQVFLEIVAERPGIDREDLLALAMQRIETTSVDPRNSFSTMDGQALETP